MISLQRNLICRNLRGLRSLNTSSSISSKKDDKSEKKNLENEKKISKEEATVKLNNLLNLMIQKDDQVPKKEIKLVQAVKRKKGKEVKEKSFGEKLEVAAKDVASTLGGDAEKTESELLKILLRRSDSGSLPDVLKGIKVEKSEVPSRAQQVRQALAGKGKQPNQDTDQRKPKRKGGAEQVDILGAQPSSYFDNHKPAPAPCELTTWQSCLNRDLRLAVTHPPANVYEQLIQWTNRGIVWQFPIDNNQGLDEEKQVSFEDHIFLEEHLEGWCPEKGPIRHFMELVCIGLSKNHWLSVKEKKEHIFWFRDYFADKKQLISELGAGNISIEAPEQKELPQ